MLNEEGGVDPEQFRMEAMFDRMDCIGKSVLGLTIQCAQCHNHKYDPLKQEEYYRLFAFLNNDNEASMVTYSVQQQMLVANLTRQLRDLEAGLRHTTPDWQERMNQWEDSVKTDQPEWTVVRVQRCPPKSQYRWARNASLVGFVVRRADRPATDGGHRTRARRVRHRTRRRPSSARSGSNTSPIRTCPAAVPGGPSKGWRP